MDKNERELCLKEEIMNIKTEAELKEEIVYYEQGICEEDSFGHEDPSFEWQGCQIKDESVEDFSIKEEPIDFNINKIGNEGHSKQNITVTKKSEFDKDKCLAGDEQPESTIVCNVDLFHVKNEENPKIVQKNKFKCIGCSYETNVKKNLLMHLRIHAGEKPFKCGQNSSLKEHLRIHTGEKPFQCGDCSFSTAKKSGLIRHLKIHTGEKPFQCRYCSFSTAHKANLKTHLRIHTGEKPFHCRDCSFSAAKNSDLNRHLKVHTGEKPFFQHGDSSFSGIKNSDLNGHLRITPVEKPFKCEDCSFSTALKGNLKTHLRIHTGEKPFHCGDCSFSAAKKSDLKRHLKIHTGEKPFQCGDCSFSTAHKANLKTHLRIHTGREKPFHCGDCSYSAAKNSDLNRHLRIHTGEKPFQCGDCSFSTVDRVNLKTKNTNMRVKTNYRDDKLGAVAALHREGLSVRTIGERLHMPFSSVQYWVKRLKETPGATLPTRKSWTGRPRKTSTKTDTMLRRAIVQQPSLSARELKHMYPKQLGNISLRTIQERLQKHLKMPAGQTAKI